MPQCYMMIGIPGSGKSTYFKELLSKNPELKTASSDAYIEKIAKQKGQSYDAVYQDSINHAIKWMNSQIQSFIENKQDFVWDQTNLVQSARLKKLKNLISNGYEVTAIVIEIPQEELEKRLNKRVSEGGKTISKKVISDMAASYERPTYNEGFKSILLLNEHQEIYELPTQNQKLKP